MNDTGRTPGQAGTDDKLSELSRSLAAALGRGDPAAVAGLTRPDFTAIDAQGLVHPRDEAAPQAWANGAPDGADRSVRSYGTVATVTTRGRTADGEAVTLEVWVKDGADWRALVHHRNLLASPDAAPSHPAPVARPADAKPPRCENPIETVPYAPKEPAEADIIRSFQTLELAVTENHPEEWVNHVADEFVVFRTRQRPSTKADRADQLSRARAVNGETFVAAVEWMNLWIFGDAAVMRADHMMPGNRRPPYRATRVWVKRDGRWQMAVSQQTNRPA